MAETIDTIKITYPKSPKEIQYESKIDDLLKRASPKDRDAIGNVFSAYFSIYGSNINETKAYLSNIIDEINSAKVSIDKSTVAKFLFYEKGGEQKRKHPFYSKESAYMMLDMFDIYPANQYMKTLKESSTWINAPAVPTEATSRLVQADAEKLKPVKIDAANLIGFGSDINELKEKLASGHDKMAELFKEYNITSGAYDIAYANLSKIIEEAYKKGDFDASRFYDSFNNYAKNELSLANVLYNKMGEKYSTGAGVGVGSTAITAASSGGVGAICFWAANKIPNKKVKTWLKVLTVPSVAIGGGWLSTKASTGASDLKEAYNNEFKEKKEDIKDYLTSVNVALSGFKKNIQDNLKGDKDAQKINARIDKLSSEITDYLEGKPLMFQPDNSVAYVPTAKTAGFEEKSKTTTFAAGAMASLVSMGLIQGIRNRKKVWSSITGTASETSKRAAASWSTNIDNLIAKNETSIKNQIISSLQSLARKSKSEIEKETIRTMLKGGIKAGNLKELEALLVQISSFEKMDVRPIFNALGRLKAGSVYERKALIDIRKTLVASMPENRDKKSALDELIKESRAIQNDPNAPKRLADAVASDIMAYLQDKKALSKKKS